MENQLLVPKTVKTVEDFNNWLRPEKNDIYHPLNIEVIHKKHNCEAFNFHENQSGFDGNMYYHNQNTHGFLKCKISSLNSVFKFVYKGTNTATKPTQAEIDEYIKWNRY